MSKKVKKILLALIFLTAIIVGLIVVFVSHNSPSSVKGSETEKPPKPVPPPTKPPISKNPPASFPISNIPVERRNNWGEIRELNSAEEKMVIESLASQVNINPTKSYFDYKWGFNMIPAVREANGDCDRAFYLFTDQGKFFVKVNNFSDLTRFEYEKESMLAINEAVPDFAPHPICLGNLPEGGKFLVVNFIEARWDDRLIIENQKSLTKSLAQLHQKKSPNGKFGFHFFKNNHWKDNWATFFYENRWQPLWKRVCEKYPQDQELKKWGNIIGEKVIPDLLGNLPVKPVLVHGNLIFDAWDTNSQTKQPWVFDTYSYYGHNEMDLSLIHYSDQEFDWLGGKVPEGCEGKFSESEFLAEYQKYHPLPPGFEKRRDLYRLYDWLFRNISRNGHPDKKFLQKALTMMKNLGENLINTKFRIKCHHY